MHSCPTGSIVILENLRSCYNVGNIIRTADALGRSVYTTGYTPSPNNQPKVKKTSLGAEDNVFIKEFSTTLDAIFSCKQAGYTVIVAELSDDAIALSDQVTLENLKNLHITSDVKNNGIKKPDWHRAVIFGNEVVWVEPETLASVDAVVKIPMMWVKESLNVWQTAAIFMWELR